MERGDKWYAHTPAAAVCKARERHYSLYWYKSTRFTGT